MWVDLFLWSVLALSGKATGQHSGGSENRRGAKADMAAEAFETPSENSGIYSENSEELQKMSEET